MKHHPTLLAGLLLVGAILCGLPAGRADEEAEPEWLDCGAAKVSVSLPVVPHAEKDVALPRRERFVIAATADGTLRYSLGNGAMTDDVGRLRIGAAAGNTEALEGFSKVLRLSTRMSSLRKADGTSRVRLHLRADGALPWICFLWLGERTVETGIGITQLLFSVRPADAATGGHYVLPYSFAPDPGPETLGEAPRRIALRLTGGSDDAQTIRVQEIDEGTEAQKVLATLDWRSPGPEQIQRLASLIPPTRGVEVTLTLARSGARKFTVADVLPIVSSLQASGVRVAFQAPPAGFLASPDRLPVLGPRHPFGAVPKYSRRTERWVSNVQEALRWLKAHQAPNGSWEAAGFRNWCDGERVARGPDGLGKQAYDVGVTGLALQAFLGAGYTHRGKHPYQQAISQGLEYLQDVQDAEGAFGPRDSPHWVYNHGAASWAMVEACGLSGSSTFKSSAQRALDFIALCRNPYFAWRYGVKPGDNDTSVTAWMLMPIALAKILNDVAIGQGKPPVFTVDEESYDGARAWLDKMTDRDYGRVGYIQRGGSSARPQALIDRFPGDKVEAMTGLGIVLRTYIGEDPRKSLLVKKGLGLLEKLPPVWNPASGDIDMYYWYWGSMAMWQGGSKRWRGWEEAIDKSIRAHQRRDTTHCLYKGSWDPIGPWGPDGGRVYATALMALVLETPTRYARRFGR